MTESLFASARRAPARWKRRLPIVILGALLLAAVVWGLVIAGLWGYSWWKLGGLDIQAVEQGTDPLGSLGFGDQVDAGTVLLTVTEPRDPTMPRQPDLAAPVALVQAGGSRPVPAVLLLPLTLPVSVAGQGPMTVEEIFTEGGDELLASSLTDYAELRIDHLVSINVDTLPRLVELVGDVEVCGTAGCRALTAQQVRAAMTAPDPDALVEVMTDTVRGIAASVGFSEVARSPLMAKRFIDIVAEDVRTDVSLRGTALLDLAEELAGAPRAEVDQIPLLRNPQTGALVPLEEPAMVRFQHLRDGTSLEAGDDRESMESMAVTSVQVAVLNGVGTAGLASSIEERLQNEGFEVIGTGNVPGFGRSMSTVSYRSDDPMTEAAAIVLAERLDNIQLDPREESPDFEGEPVDLLVTIGEDLDEQAG